MSNSYGTWYRESVLDYPLRGWHGVQTALSRGRSSTSGPSESLQLPRIVVLATVVLLLTFSAVLHLVDAAGVHAYWLEVCLASLQLATLAASYVAPVVRRHFGQMVRIFCFLTAGLFVTLATANGFDSNYALGLLFVIPGLGAGYGVATRAVGSLTSFFVVSIAGAAAGCMSTAGVSGSSILFLASLLCISCVTLVVAAGWVDARRRYLASEERYRAVVEQASDGIFMLDADTLEILDANRAFCEMMDASLSELRSVRVDSFLEWSAGGRIDRDVFAGRGSSQVECVVRRGDATTIFGELKVDRIRHNDGDVLSVVVHDITSRKEYEKRLLRAKEAAEEIARFKSALLANMSHEIRTPLSSILGWTAVLGSEVPNRQRELVALIERSGKRLHATLDSVLELAQLQARTKVLRSETFDLNDVVRCAADEARPDAESKGLRLTLRAADKPTWVDSDPACLRRVLTHVLDNAIKFTGCGDVTVSVLRTGTEVALVVEDTGMGIDSEFLPAAFDEFKQQSEGLSRAHEGSGLGLSLVRRLTELLGGRVSLESEEGVGTTLTVYLPDAARVRRRRRAGTRGSSSTALC